MFPRLSNCHHFASVLFVALLAAAFGMTACGGSSSSNTSQTPPPPITKNSMVQINIGDSPCDRVLAFATNITSMMLNNSNGTSAPIISSSTPFEIMRLADTMQPMNVLTIPQGTYTYRGFSEILIERRECVFQTKSRCSDLRSHDRRHCREG